MNLSSDTLITVQAGVLLAMFFTYGKLVYKYARAELTQEFMQKDLNAAHAKIRDLESKIHGKN